MKKTLAIYLAAGTLAVLGWEPSRADAQYPGYGAYLSPFVPFNTYTNDYIPYFAAHPPVYYSAVTPRPYGFSPYACPPGVVPAEIRATEPLVIQNVYYGLGAGGPPATRAGRPTPLRIVNPYVKK